MKKIGPYELIEEVSRGGQGVVYRARQPGMKRDIALKRMIAGAFASPATSRRFEREVEATSSLNHPGVVKIYGMDVVEGGPVLAMEWVEGDPITEWARGQGEAPPGRAECLRMFLRVCDAVQHAHQNGILHRDLKPSNILVDGTGQPRVLDFGLAKHIEIGGDAQPSVTQSGFVGTPAYASPEQFEGGGVRLDARSDVYSLGVILFEMLTGERPYRPETGMREYLDALEREAAPRPSALRSGLDAEIDAIVHQALATRRGDRFASVGHLADDVRRYLAGEPVLAHPPSTWYEVKKLMRRNRAAAALSTVLLLTVVLFSAFAHQQALAIEQERDSESRARGVAERASARAELENEKAEAVLEFLLRDMLEAAGAGKPDLLVRQVLDAAAERVPERFGDRPAVEVRVRLAVGESYRLVGRFDAAEHQLEAARVQMERLETPNPLERVTYEQSMARVCHHLAREPEAVAHFQRAIDILMEQDPVPWYRVQYAETGLGMVHYQIGDSTEGRKHFARARDILEQHLPGEKEQLVECGFGLALHTQRVGRWRESRGEFEALLVRCRELKGVDSLMEAKIRRQLSFCDRYDGRPEEAEENLREALRIQESLRGDAHPQVAVAIGDLGEFLVYEGRLDEGASLLRRALAVAARAVGADSLFYCMHEVRLGETLMRQRKIEEASEILERCLARFVETHGHNYAWSYRCHEGLAKLYGSLGDLDTAIEHWKHVINFQRGSGVSLSVRGDRLKDVARILNRAGRLEECFDVLEEYLDTRSRSPDWPKAKAAAEVRKWAAWMRRKGAPERAARWERKAEELDG